ncbi:hypothetical protein L249_6562 [Ophiocordyceps polyrhachis-furcata BCC 54312]|uniref:Acyl-coenzyme A diphosphatase SCS3 n=1 Tax=Ophiocordyceps polyrhachis-furcata BCC 54312 TaxID=1330021 RepID=A0A367LJP4_9HYPO|nr:hypothetical protein L249_6562 [Ophiocordyceps polyrhachis-furcata BCC 54312]
MATTTTTHSSRSDPAPPRNSPYLPTPLERLAVSVYPLILVFGAIFSLVSPETRAAPYDVGAQSHEQSSAPSYFARKSNVFNVVFVKRGWGWTTFAFVFFLFAGGLESSSSPSSSAVVDRVRVQAFLRWCCATAWWVCVTQWCFGPALIDRGFRWSGGRCEGGGEEAGGDDFMHITAVACRAAGGRWNGGHDISGHVFLLVLGSWFLAQEVAWPVMRAAAARRRRMRMRGGAATTTTTTMTDDRCVFMPDGAVKGVGVEVEASFGVAAKVALGVVAMKLWMLLMTAIYFHTWFEKFTGLATALAGAYGLYIVPRFVPGAIKIPTNLPETVKTIFAKAKSDGALTFYPTQAAIVKVGAIPFQLRFSPSLVKKPEPKRSSATSSAAVDPFANPPPSLYVAGVGKAHYLVLNKFAIVAEHLILATNDFESQTELLGLRDVEATLACLRAYGGGLFAFFNSGVHSGASQPHRHVQLLPIEGMRQGLVPASADDEARWEPLMGRQDLLDGAPFVSFAEDMDDASSAAHVHAAYLRLYRRACRALGVDGAEEQVDGEARVSYNLALTDGRIVVCPRRAEGEGDVAVNGALLAGTALVKGEDVWRALVAEPGRLGEVLGRVGVARGGITRA